MIITKPITDSIKTIEQLTDIKEISKELDKIMEYCRHVRYEINKK